jgi:putative ABC transport system permease protein
MRRFCVAVISWLTPSRDREWVIGDTVEELEVLEHRIGRAAANRWLRSEMRRVIVQAPRHWGSTSRSRRPFFRSVSADVRDALRRLTRTQRGTTTLALAILALTMTAGITTFSVVDAVALRALPYPGSDQLIAIGWRGQPGGRIDGVTSQDYFSWRESTRSFSGLAGAIPEGQRRLESGALGGDVTFARATANLFDVLNVQPALGRTFHVDDETPGRDNVIVLTHDAWIRSFGGDPGVIGRSVTFVRGATRMPHVIVGVLPAGVTYPLRAGPQVEAFRPYVATPAERDQTSRGRAYALHAVGRLRPGNTLEGARAEIEQVIASVRATHGTVRADAGTVVLPLHDRVVGPAKSWLVLVLAAVGCLVLVGCVNVASLLLARAVIRHKELATRAALGATRGQLARILAAEGLAIAFVSSAAALVLSYWGVGLAKAALPDGLARTADIALDGRVLVAAVIAAVVSGLLAGGAPAWRLSRTDLFDQLRSGGGLIGGQRQARSLGAFLVAEVAFVAVLLVVTTLVVASFVAITTMDLGFERRNVIALFVEKSGRDVPRDQQRAEAAGFFEDVLGRVRAVPGVTHVGLIDSSEPLGGGSTTYSLVIPGIGELNGADMFETRGVSPEYFAAMGLRLLRGRTFTSDDRAGAPRAAIINELAATRYFPGRDPIGESIEFREAPAQIVGIVQNVRMNGPEADLRTELYVPLVQWPHGPWGRLIVRTAGAPAATAAAVREAIRPALTGGSVSEPTIISDAFRRLTADRRFNAGLMTLFGALAVVIGAIGIYGTMAFVVAQGTRAIGLRMALGATRSDVLWSVLRASLWRVGVGAAVGVLAARGLADLFTSLVFGVETTSLAVYATVAACLAAIGLGAAFVPALRASRLDPLAALRAE